MGLNLTRKEIRGVVVLATAGELSLGRGDEELPAAVQAELDAGARRLVLDLTRLAWMDSSGVGAIVACSKRAADAGAVLRVAASPTGAVHRIVVATHLDRVFDVLHDADTAVRAFER